MVRESALASPEATVVVSWQRDSVHVWGWDGVQTMPPMWLYNGFRASGWPGSPSSHGFHSSLDVVAPSGERLRPISVRLDAISGLTWLRGAAAAPSDPARWFAALALLAADVAASGAVVPRIERNGYDALAAVDAVFSHVAADVGWEAIATPPVTAALDELSRTMPPICLPDVHRDDANRRRDVVQVIFERFVDGSARAALMRDGWEPDVPRDRSPATAVARLVFRSLTGQDRRVQSTRSAHTDALITVDEAFRRLGSRARGEPVLDRRLRLVVPDDRFAPWRVDLELVDEADPGRWCSAGDVWARTPLAVEVAGGPEHLPLLEALIAEMAGTVADAVEVLGAFAEARQPTSVEFQVDTADEQTHAIDELLDQAPAALQRLGISLIGPEHLVRSQVAVRGRATPAQPSDRRAGLNRDTIIEWTFTAADSAGPVAISDAELARAEETGSSLLHIGHRWVRIDPAALRKARARHDEYLRRIDELERAGADPLTLLKLAADAAAAGDDVAAEPDAVPDGSNVSAAWTGLLLGGLPDAHLSEDLESPSFTGTLRPYQRRGLSWLRFLDRLGLGGCLADDMGLGKTATTLAHLVDRPGPHLVVCPLSVVHNWETEAGRFAPSMRVRVHHGSGRHTGSNDTDEADTAVTLAGYDLVVTTYGLVNRDLAVLEAVDWSTVVLDEAQFVKNPGTRAARGVRKLRAGQRIALTGTPVENRLSELWAILDWVNPGMLGTRDHFRHRYSKPIERGAGNDPNSVGDDGSDALVAAEAAAALKAITQPFVLRRSKADRQLVPDLPDKIEQVAFAGLTREQSVLYQKVVDQLLEEAGAMDATATAGNSRDAMKRRSIVLAALTKLKQICNHPAHALGDGSRLHGRSGKLTRFDELVDELIDVGERALVFTQFVEMGSLLQRHVAERLGWSVPFLQGSMSKSRRDRVVADFQAGLGPPLLIISLKAGGTGLNLTAASQVIHYDRWWNPAVENQATDRAWRIGQGQTVLVHKLVCEGTVEERIAKVIDDKQALADLVVGQGEAWLSELSTGQLRDLVRLDPSATSASAPSASRPPGADLPTDHPSGTVPTTTARTTTSGTTLRAVPDLPPPGAGR